MKYTRKEQSRAQHLQKVPSIEQSIRELRQIYPELTNEQLARRYEQRYGVRGSRVLHMLAKQNQPTGGGVA
jgi:hypothetical protein